MKYLKEEYVKRINKSIDYINDNIEQNLKLEDIAKQSNFSCFHFHRIFKAATGETLNNFVKRMRLEKAALMLLKTDNSITRIALGLGFSSSQAFARDFKKYFKESPSEFRNNKYDKSKICNIKSKNWKELKTFFYYDDIKGRHIFDNNKSINMKVEIKKLPKMHVAYVRHIGPFKGDGKLFESLFEKLCKLGFQKGLIKNNTKFLSVYYDDPEITDESKCRVDVCITIDEDVIDLGELNKKELKGGDYAVARFELKDSNEYVRAWNLVYSEWLPSSGYEPADDPCFELYQNDPKEHPEGLHIVDICVPVKKI